MEEFSTPTSQPSSSGEQRAVQSMAIPLAIIIAGGLIGFAIWYTGSFVRPVAAPQPQTGEVFAADKARAVNTATEHVLGNPQAPVTVIEYADLECPYCKDYHKVLEATLKSHIASGQVKHVFRHLPLADLHPRAVDEAIAAECVARVSGNDAFWKYLTRIFTITPSNNKLDPTLLDRSAQELGVRMDAWQTCRIGSEARAQIEADVNDALRAGATGTPFTIIIAGDGTRYPYSGSMSTAQLEERVKAAIALRK